METGPLTVLEAFAAGLPVAGTNLGGISELLNSQEGCFLLSSEPLAWKNLFLDILKKNIILSKFKPPKTRNFYDLESDFDKFILKNLKKKYNFYK